MGTEINIAGPQHAPVNIAGPMQRRPRQDKFAPLVQEIQKEYPGISRTPFTVMEGEGDKLTTGLQNFVHGGPVGGFVQVHGVEVHVEAVFAFAFHVHHGFDDQGAVVESFGEFTGEARGHQGAGEKALVAPLS